MDVKTKSTLFYSFIRHGVRYTFFVTATDECKLPQIPALLKLKKQFIDIVENHAAHVGEKLDDLHTHAAAAELRKEYFAERSEKHPDPATAAVLSAS